MLISKLDPITGKVNTRELDINQSQIDRWQNGELIQTVFPLLTDGDREFLKSGITEESWDMLFDLEEE